MWAVGAGPWALGCWLRAAGYDRWFGVCGLWCVVCGLWSMVGGLWSVVGGLWVGGLWSLVFRPWCVVFGLWLVVYGLWCVVGGLWLVVPRSFVCSGDVQITSSGDVPATFWRFIVFEIGTSPEQLMRTPPEQVLGEGAKPFFSPQ